MIISLVLWNKESSKRYCLQGGLASSTKEAIAMSTYESLSHSKWDCKYHVVFVPKCRKKTL
jgi:hypothetical protein